MTAKEYMLKYGLRPYNPVKDDPTLACDSEDQGEWYWSLPPEDPNELIEESEKDYTLPQVMVAYMKGHRTYPRCFVYYTLLEALTDFEQAFNQTNLKD